MCYNLSNLIQKILTVIKIYDIILQKAEIYKEMNIDALSNLVITKVRSIITHHNPENTKVKRKDRPCWAVVIKYEGETIYTSNGKEFLSDINHIVVLPRGCSYDWECTRSGHFTIIEFDSPLTFSEPMSVAVKNGDKILKMFKDIEYDRSFKKTLGEIEIIRDLYSILLALCQNESAPYLPTQKQQKIDAALEYISKRYNESITNDSLAAAVGMSTVYFRKLFTKVVGISPISFARNLRIEKAKEMLKSDYGTLSDIATSLGYASLYDFSRDFKKHTGVAPSRF